MIEVEFICRNCGAKFKARIYEKGEAQEKRAPTGPVRCPNPKCRSTAVERH